MVENVKYITKEEVILKPFFHKFIHIHSFFRSWHVYNDKNKEKVRKDEKAARVEKEKIEERAKAADREHRLNILRSRANLMVEEPPRIQMKEPQSQRFELFPNDKVNANEQDHRTIPKSFKSSKINGKTEDDVLADHTKNDPVLQRNDPIRKSKGSSGKDYSFV